MLKQRLFLLLLGLSVFVGGLAVFLVPSREPCYGGKSLREWVEISGALQLKAAEAVRARQAILKIGTNAIPFLLTWIRYEPPAWRTKLLRLINNIFSCRLVDSPNVRADGAARALEWLQSKAETVIPALAILMDQPSCPIRARRVTDLLHALGNELLSADLALMTNKSARVRLETLETLSLGRTNVSPLPILFMGLHDTDARVAEKAARYLGAFGGKATVIVPELAQSLKDQRTSVRAAAIRSLLRFGTRSRSAVSPLLDLVRASHPETRKIAIYALESIDPEALEGVRAQ